MTNRIIHGVYFKRETLITNLNSVENKKRIVELLKKNESL